MNREANRMRAIANRFRRRRRPPAPQIVAYVTVEEADAIVDRMTSSRVSTVAGRLVGKTDDELMMLYERDVHSFLSDVRAVAASALSQDRRRGQD